MLKMAHEYHNVIYATEHIIIIMRTLYVPYGGALCTQRKTQNGINLNDKIIIHVCSLMLINMIGNIINLATEA